MQSDRFHGSEVRDAFHREPARDPFRLDGLTAVVTGAGRGIGAAIALALDAAGARVALAARSAHELDAMAEQMTGAAEVVPCDLSSQDGVDDLASSIEQKLDRVDIVVHSAGVQHRAPAVEFSRADWDRVIAVNTTAPFFLSQRIARQQIGSGAGGSHIFVASIASRVGLSNASAYVTSKSGVAGTVRSLSREWAQYGIRVNGIGPGYVHTSLTDDVIRSEAGRELLARIPMGRFGTAQEIACAAVYLGSSASSYTTGQVLMVDGGWTAS